jgi:radical SAM superfamily enzyme YgiQ (UPF0313 family)
MGWRSLESEMQAREPAFVGIGEEAVSCVEGLRFARIAKKFGARVIAGGCFFGHVAPHALATGLVDVVVHGEGEMTIVELVCALRDPPARGLEQVCGVSFVREGRVITTPPRELLRSLDSLPFPAYDLLPVDRYGARSVNHPHLAAIELSRGCFGSCDFCILWKQMGQLREGRAVPRLRVKSPERALEEVRLLVRSYGRRYLGWVDPCFNADPETPARLAELMLREGISLGQSAWVRTDALLRDAASGALETCVRAGLNEVYLGIERADSESLASLGKTAGVDEAREALALLRERHPEVLAIGSFIYGLPGDTPGDVWAIHRLANELQLDQFFFIPLTPLPGTTGWRDELWDPSGERFREFNFLPSGRPHGVHAALERALLLSLLFNWPSARIRSLWQTWFGPDSRRRRIGASLFRRGARFHLRKLVDALRGTHQGLGMVFPEWYER